MAGRIMQGLAALLLTCCGPNESVLVTIEASVLENPNSVLSAVVTVQTSETCRVLVEFTSDETEEQRSGQSVLGTSHQITVVGMRPEVVYRLRPVATCDGEDRVRGNELSFTTGSLPEGVPEFVVTVHEPDQIQPGVTLFGPAVLGPNANEVPRPLYIGVDESGMVVWYYFNPADDQSFADRDVKMLPDGNLLISVIEGLRVITVGGETVTEASTEGFHHDGIRLSDGRYMVLSAEIREVDVPSLGGLVMVKGDVIVELDEDSRVTWTWSTFDHLDRTRFPSAASRVPDPVTGVYDWTHSNAVCYIAEDNSVLLSSRHQNWVIKIDRESAEIIWRLGIDGDFDLANLDPLAGVTWFFSQHAPEMHADGTLLLYDNGNDRPLPGASKYSRAVMYRLDEEQSSVEQVWAYRTDHFTGFLGDADLLENGNVLACAGGQQEPGVPAQIVEVTGETPARKVWELEMEEFVIYRATRLSSFWLE